MKKIYCYECNKYKKLINGNGSNNFIISIICSKCGYNNDRIFKEEESIEILKTFGSIDNINE